eukprot:8041740-Pyramimonas_sp.AAC.1
MVLSAPWKPNGCAIDSWWPPSRMSWGVVAASSAVAEATSTSIRPMPAGNIALARATLFAASTVLASSLRASDAGTAWDLATLAAADSACVRARS